MSKFCNYCGTQLEDSATFCANCGAQVEASAAPKKAATTAPQSTTSNVQLEAPLKGNNFFAQNKNKLIGIGIAAAVVIIIITVASSIISGWGYKGPIKNYYKAVNKESGEIYLKTMPEFVAEYRDIDEDDADETMEETLEYLGNSVGKDPKVSYEILEKTEMLEKQLEAKEESINKTYKDELDDEVEVSAGYNVLLKITAKGSRDKQESYTTLSVLEIDGDWYLMN